ncbi:MAG: HAMP domain-containing protein [Anaerolineales bacterium]|nr:HAMP domain-containing protein [Anaerolineales bacterium]
MRLRLFLSFLLLILITTLSVTFLARWQMNVALERFSSRGGFAGAEALVTSLENYYYTNQTWEGVTSLFQTHKQGGQGMGPGGPGPENETYLLADPSNILLVDTSQVNFTPSPREITPEEQERAIAIRVNRKIVGYLIPAARPGLAPPIENGLLTVINRGALFATAISGVLAVILALILGYVLLRPVRTLTQASAALGAGDLDQRVPVEGDDEIAHLGRTFNLMAESLQQSQTRRKAMTADIAHELRTPLSVQRANLEAIQDGIYPLTPESIQPVYEQTLLLERLVDDLRTLALADAGELELIKTETDILGLVQRVVEQFQPHAKSRNQTISSTLPPSCAIVEADPGRVEQILGNLLTNAIRHTPEDGQITVEVQCASGKVQLSVRDTGPGIPEDSLPYLFERFYRGDRSRSRVEGGTGLGLSIARRLADAHGGKLEAANYPTGGAVFTLTLPVG